MKMYFDVHSDERVQCEHRAAAIEAISAAKAKGAQSISVEAYMATSQKRSEKLCILRRLNGTNPDDFIAQLSSDLLAKTSVAVCRDAARQVPETGGRAYSNR
jgi:hypothetical protein